MTQTKAVSSGTDTDMPSKTGATPTKATSPHPLLLWSPFRWLSISVGVFLVGSYFYWGWNPDLVPTPPHYSVSLGMAHLVLFGWFAGFFRSLFLRQARRTQEPKDTRTSVLLGVWLFVAAGALGLLGGPGSLVGMVMFFAGWVVLLFHKLDDWFGTHSTTSKAPQSQAIFRWYEISLWGVLWLAVSIVVSLYGLWFAIAAPVLSIACAILWLLWDKDKVQRSAVWWVGLIGLLVTPFFTNSIAFRNQLPTYGISNHPGFLLAVQHAPLLTAEQRVKMLLTDNVSSYLSPEQRTKVYLLLTKLWLQGTLSSPMHRELARYMSARWLQQLHDDTKLQKAVLQKMLEGFFPYRKIHGGVGHQHDLQQELVDIHRKFPKLRKTLETSLLQGLVTLTPCQGQSVPCQAQALLRAWLSDMLRTGQSQQTPLPIYFPLHDLLWETFHKLPLTHQQRFNKLTNYLRFQTLQSSQPTSASARIFVYSILKSENFYLDKVKPKSSRTLMDRWLTQLIQHDLRSKQQELQFMGFMLFGQACRSQQNGLSFTTCNRLVRLFPLSAWRAFRAQAKSKAMQKLILSIEEPSLALTQRVEMERRVLSLSLKANKLAIQKSSHLGVLLAKGDKISKEEKVKQLQAIQTLDAKVKKLKQQKKRIEASYRMDVPRTSVTSK